MDSNVGRAITGQLIVKLRMFVQIIQTSEIVEKDSTGTLRFYGCSVEVKILLPVVGPNSHQIALVPDEIDESVDFL